MTKLCIILTWKMRTYDSDRMIRCYQQYLSSYGTIDLCIFTWKNRGYSNNHGYTDLHKKQEERMDEDVIRSHYSQFPFLYIKTIVLDDFNSFIDELPPSRKKIYDTPFRNHSKITTSLPIEYKYQQAIRYLASIDYQEYSTIMLTRPDFEVLHPIPFLHPEEDIVYYQHICDRCMDHCWFGTAKTLIKQLYTIYDDYEKNQQEIPSHSELNRDNNELLIHQCIKNGMGRKVIHEHYGRLVYFRSLG